MGKKALSFPMLYVNLADSAKIFNLGKEYSDKWFKIQHLKKDLETRSVSGGFTTVSAQLISFMLSTVSLIVMARILTPEDFGLVSMVTAITGFVIIFQDLGLSSAIIQRTSINQQEVSAIFWVNLAIGLAIATLVAFSAPLLASFYGESRVMNITIAFASSIFIASLSLQHGALLKRQMLFKKLSAIQISSSVLSLILGIVLALAGFGYWAIIFQTITLTVSTSVLLWIACDWRPSIVLRTANIKSFIRFGVGITGYDLLNYFSRNADNILIGKFLGPAALGLYSRAYQLLMLPITHLRNPLNAVAFPALSALQNDGDKYRNYYRKYLFSLAFFSMPLIMFLAIFSKELILIVLGEQWIQSSYIFILLAISGFIQPVAGTAGIVLITAGKTGRYFLYGVFNSTFIILAFIIGIKWDLEGIAIAYAIANYLLLVPSLLICYQRSPITIGIFFSEISGPLCCSLASGLFMFVFKFYNTLQSDILTFIIGFSIGAVIYVVCWFATTWGRGKLETIRKIGLILYEKIAGYFSRRRQSSV